MEDFLPLVSPVRQRMYIHETTHVTCVATLDPPGQKKKHVHMRGEGEKRGRGGGGRYKEGNIFNAMVRSQFSPGGTKVGTTRGREEEGMGEELPLLKKKNL